MSAERSIRFLAPCLFALASAASARPAGPTSGSPAFERIGIDRGLSQSVVTAIHQDELGFMWFGTQEGLNRYDGSRFKVYRHDPNDPGSLSSSSIEAIAGDSRGRLWLGTDDGGLNVLDPRTGEVMVLQHESGKSRGLSHDRVFDIAFAGDGTAWLGTEAGLNRVEDAGDSLVRIGPGRAVSAALGDKAVLTVLADGGGSVWAGTREAGLFRVTDGAVVRYGPGEPEPRRLDAEHIRDLALGADGSIWVASPDGGLGRIRGDLERSVAAPVSGRTLPDPRLTAIRTSEDGGLLAGSESGYLYRLGRDGRLAGSHRHDPSIPDSVADGTIEDIFVDRTGVLWIGSYAGAISKSKSLTGKVVHGLVGPHDGERLPDPLVRTIWIDGGGGDAWIGTAAGLARAGPERERYRIHRHREDDPRSLSHDNVYALLRRDNGQLWVGTERGLNRFIPAGEGFERYLKDDGRGLPDNRVRDLAEDGRGRLWIATEDGLALYHDATDSFEVFRDDGGTDGLSGNEITALFADGVGSLWIGTNNAGLNRRDLETGEFVHYPAGPDGLSHASVWDVRRRGDTVWAGTFSGGLNRIELDTGEITHYLEEDGLVNNVVYQIVPDDRDRLWLSTNAGLSVFNPETEKFLNYNPGDGLQNYEYNSNASFRDTRGWLYFGGINGLDIIDASRVMPPSTPAVAALTDFQLFNQGVDPDADERVSLDASVEYADRLDLGYRAAVFSLGLGALHFSNPDTNRLRYRLVGLHEDWLAAEGAPHRVTFNSLPAGEYRLRIQASARGAEWGPERTLEIRMAPPPWLSPAAYAAYAALFLLILVAAVRAHFRSVRAQRRHVEQLNRMVAERTMELEGLNEQLQDTNRQLELAVRRDPLTGLANRRELLEWLPREQSAALRAYRDWLRRGQPDPEPELARLCFIAVDIDDFKEINDTWGHMAGDRILREFARRLGDHCRASDLAVRWGGEEFLLVMRSIGPRGARHLVERIRRAVETRPVALEGGTEVRMTCSLGFACYPFSSEHPGAGDWEDIVGLADAALYAAKRAGKNTWIGIGCPGGLDADAVAALLRDPDVRRARSERAVIWLRDF